MALPATSQQRSASDPKAIIAAAYPQARRIAFSRWLAKVDQTEIESLVGAAVVKLLDGEAEVIDVPRTVKYLTNFVDWRARDHLRAEDRRDEAPLPDDETEAPGSLQEALTAPDPSPEEAIDSAHTRQILVELKKGIPSPVNRLIVHLAFSEERTCPQIARSVNRVLGEQLTPKAVEMRKYQALKALTAEWGKVLKGEHCHKFATATGADQDALSRYALDLFDPDDTEDVRLRALVAAHLEHCALCRAAVAERRRGLRRAGLLAVPILVGAHEGGHPAQPALAHAPGVFERALESVRSGLGRGAVRAAEVAPNGGSNAGEMIGSAGAGGGVAVGGSLVTKLVVVGTAAVCAMGGQQICAHLFATRPAVRHHHHRRVRQHRHHHKTKTTARLTPSVPAPPRNPPAARAGQLAQPGAKTIQHDQQQTQASAPAASPPATRSSSAGASSSSTTASSDPTFNQAAPTHSSSSPSPSSSGGGGSSSGGGGSSGGDSTFENLP